MPAHVDLPKEPDWLVFIEKHLGLFRVSVLVLIPVGVALACMTWLLDAKNSSAAAIGFMLAMAVTIVIATVGVQHVERRVRGRRRHRFLGGSQPLSDEAFLSAIAADPRTEEIPLVARRIMGRMCGLPPEFIHPHHEMNTLWTMADELGEGDTDNELIAYVAEETGATFRRWRRAVDQTKTFGEFAAALPKDVVPR